MSEDDFLQLCETKCFSISVVQKNEGILEGPLSSEFEYDYKGSSLSIVIEQCLVRKTTIEAKQPIPVKKLWSAFILIERLLMLFDGRFYEIESVEFNGDDCSNTDCSLIAQEYVLRRLAYCKTDPAYCYLSHVFLRYDEVLSPDVLIEWEKLQDEIDMVHQVFLYNMASTGITHEIKCAGLIEGFESLTEIIGAYDKFFPSLKLGEQKTTLKMCIDSVISKYGRDVFSEEFSKNKDRFLQILVNTRNRIMHIKRNQLQDNYLSGAEAVLYSVKIIHLYRVVILTLLGIDYPQYRQAVIDSVKKWNAWEGVLNNFMGRLK